MDRKSWRLLRLGLAWLACAAWLVPAPARAASPRTSAPPMSVFRDVKLDDAGHMLGTFLDAQGQPIAGQQVVVQRQDGKLLTTHTDGHGRFALGNMTGGLCRVAVADTSVFCRCWTSSVAPPAATPQLLIVSGEDVLRGQRPIGDLLFSGPMLIGLVIAAAIAIPIAIHNSQDDAS
ncbi:MAG: carboxypeptidase-like regulatory domain-containing protein [Pirellulaceae bacterium]